MKYWNVKKVAGIILAAALTATVATGCGESSANEDGSVQITNVSYDPTRELYTAYNEVFAAHWKENDRAGCHNYTVTRRFWKTGIGSCERFGSGCSHTGIGI